jgi:hypothetical protein
MAVVRAIFELLNRGLFVVMIFLLLLTTFLIMSGGISTLNRVPPLAPGVYVQSEGFALILRKNMRYRLCDATSCIEGGWHDTPAPQSLLRRLWRAPPLHQVRLDSVYMTEPGKHLDRMIIARHRTGWRYAWDHHDIPSDTTHPYLAGIIKDAPQYGGITCLIFGVQDDCFRKVASFTDPEPR